MFVHLNGTKYDVSCKDGFSSLIAELQKKSHLLHLKLICENPNKESIESFCDKMLALDSPIECAFSLVAETETGLAQIYEFDRYRFKKRMSDRIDRAKAELSSIQKPTPVPISQHKINRMQGVAPHITHVQQKVINWDGVSSQPKEQEPFERPFLSKKRKGVREEFNCEGKVFVSEENIEDYRDFFEREGVDKNINLAEFWRKLVGITSNSPAGYRHTIISQVDRDVMVLFLKNYKKFCSGILIDNLPILVDAAGNIQRRVSFGCVSAEENQYGLILEEGSRDDVNEFTLILHADESYILPTQAAFLEKFPEKEGIIDNIFLDDADLDIKKLQGNLLDLVGEENFALTKALANIPVLSKSCKFLRGCLDVLVVADTEGLLVLLHQLSKIDYNLIEPFVSNPVNLPLLASEAGINNLIHLASFSDAKKVWWQWLVAKHVATGEPLVFTEIFAAFKKFEAELRDLGEDNLSATIPFDNSIKSCNMQVMLDVIIKIVTGGQHQVQLHCLDALNNGLMPAYYAIKDGHLRLVTSEMGLDSDFLISFSQLMNPSAFNRIMWCGKLLINNELGSQEESDDLRALSKEDYKILEKYFLQFIARKQETRFDYSQFAAICKTVSNLNKNLTESPADKNPSLDGALDYATKSSLLYIAAIANSGERGLQQLTNSNDDLKSFLKALRAFSDKYKISSELILSSIHKRGLDIKSCPSLAELKIVFELLSKDSFHISEESILCICKILSDYGDSAVKIFTNLALVAKPDTDGQINLDVCFFNYAKLLADLSQHSGQVAISLALLAGVKQEGSVCQALVKQINSMKTEARNSLFNKLATIDAEASKSFLTFDLLSSILLENTNNSSSGILNILRDKTKDLDIKYIVANQAKSRISLLNAIETILSEYNKYNYINNIDEILAKFPFLVPKTLKLIVPDLKDVDQDIKKINNLLKANNVDEKSLLQLLNQVDLKLTYIKDKLSPDGIAWIKEKVLQFFGKPEKVQQIEAYFETFSLSAFMDEAISICIKKDVDELIKKVFPEIVPVGVGASESPEHVCVDNRAKADKALYEYLWKFMQHGTKPAKFGMLAINFDPTALEHQEQLCNLLGKADGIVKHNGNLYHVQIGCSSKTAMVKIISAANDEQKTAIETLSTKIKDAYQVIGLDGYRLITIDTFGHTENVLDELVAKVRLLSPKQDAIVLYGNKYYRFDSIQQKCFELDSPELQGFFSNESADNSNRVLSTHAEKEQLKQIIGAELYHTEYELLTKLGISPIIFISDIIGLYNLNLDVFIEFLNDLSFTKERSSVDFASYKAIFLRLCSSVKDVHDLIYTLSYLNNLYKERTLSDRLELWRTLLNTIENHENHDELNLRFLRSSLEELSNYKDVSNDFLSQILPVMIPFCIQGNGSTFPIDVFTSNKDKSPQDLQEILRVATSVPSQVNVFAELESLKQFFQSFKNLDAIHSALLMGLVDDSSQSNLFGDICNNIKELSNLFTQDNGQIQKQNFINIFKALNEWPKFTDKVEKNFALQDIHNLLQGLKKHINNFDKIYEVVFASRPYPDLREFAIFLQNCNEEDENVLLARLIKIDRDPYNDRLAAEEFGFDNSRVLDIINGIVILPSHQSLSSVKRQKLVRDFSYVDVLSKGEISFSPCDDVGGAIAEKCRAEEFFLHDKEAAGSENVLSTGELQELAANFKMALQRAESNNNDSKFLFLPENRKLVLQYIAVMRELYYRKTGKIPNPAQIITIINALDNPTQQQVEIETAEGKSITTALYAALLCAKSSTVFVPTASAMLVKQDFYDKHNDLFFEAMGCTAKTIDAQTICDGIKLGGIHYGTSRDIDLLIAESRIKNVSLTQDPNDASAIYKLAMVKDETDNDLDDFAERNLARQAAEDYDDLPPTWIITAINDFVDTAAYKQIKKGGNPKPLNQEDDTKILRSFLTEHARKSTNKVAALRQLGRYSDILLREFLDTADDMDAIKLYSQYQVIKLDADDNDLECWEACPVNAISGAPERGNTFEQYGQAFLHDRLNREPAHGAKFTVKMAPMVIDSQSNKFIRQSFDYFVGLSATLGNETEIFEVGKSSTKIPAFRPKQRLQLNPVAVGSQVEKDQAILDAIRFNGYENDFCPRFILDLLVRAIDLYKTALSILGKLFAQEESSPKLQPILLFVGDAAEAFRLKEILKGKVNYACEIQVITGAESDADLKSKIAKAGLSNVITIGPPVIARGIDYKTEHPDGFFGIKAFNSTFRGKIQVLGRIGRDFKKGKFLDIVDGGFSYDSLFSRIFGLTRYQKEQQISALENRKSAEIAVERHYKQEVDACMQVVLTHFDSIRHILRSECEVDEQTLLIMRHKILFEMKTLWKKLLVESDPDNKYQENKYVRWGNDGVLETENLSAQLQTFETGICEIWKSVGIQCIKSLGKHNESGEITSRLDLLLAEDIAESFKYRKLSQQSSNIQLQRTVPVSQQYACASLDKYLDGNLAVMEYDFVNEDCNDLLDNYVQNRLKRICELYLWLGLEFNFKDKGIFENLQFLSDRLITLQENGFDHMQLYLVVQEFLSICDMFKDNNNTITQNYDSLSQSFDILPSAKKIIEQFKNELSKVFRYLGYFGIKTKWLGEIYYDLQELVKFSNSDGANEAENIKDAYKKLQKYSCILENDKSIFPFFRYIFGFHTLQSIIKKTIADIETLFISKNKVDELTVISEEAVCEGLFAVYLSDIEIARIGSLVPSERSKNWADFLKKFKLIQDEQKGFAVVEELLAFCRSHINSMLCSNSHTHSKLGTLFAHHDRQARKIVPEKMLVAQLQKIQEKIIATNSQVCFSKQHRYVESKKDSLANKILKYLPNQNTEVFYIDLDLGYGYNGINHIYELRVECGRLTSDHELFADFTKLSIIEQYDEEIFKLAEKKSTAVAEVLAEIDTKSKLVFSKQTEILELQEKIKQNIFHPFDNKKRSAQINKISKEIVDLNKEIEDLSKNMGNSEKLLAKKSIDAQIRLFQDRQEQFNTGTMQNCLLVKRFSSLEELLNFENKLRSDDDCLKNVEYRPAAVAA